MAFPWAIFIPLLLSGIQFKRQQDAQNEIDQAEQALIPGEESSIREGLIQRGLGTSSFASSAIAQPRESYERTKKVRRASQILQTTDPSQPLAYGIDALTRRLQGQQGSPSMTPSPGSPLPGMRWDPNLGRWVPSNTFIT